MTSAEYEYDVVVRNARIATAADVFVADIGIRDGRITQLGVGLDAGRQEYDAAHRVVTPGGVDGHCHLDQPERPPIVMADDFDSGTRSAACGGTTTIVPFALQQPGMSVAQAISDYHLKAAGVAHVDYAFHVILTDPTPEVLENELPELVSQGYTSFKIYMTYDDLKLDDGQVLAVLEMGRKHGGLVMIHAENAECISWLTRKLASDGRTSPRYHATSRPMLVEREATHRAIALAELVDVPIMIVHVSGSEAIDQIQWARNRGLSIFAETCPQYLFLTADDLGIDDCYEGAKAVCSPPPRDSANQQVVWSALQDTFTIFSSDHAPFRYSGADGKHPGGGEVCFEHIPNGIPGVETRMALLYSEGVLAGRLSLERFVELTATAPAKAYGLHPRKGTIAIGSDADLVIWDEHPVTITNSELHHNVDYTPYEGMTLKAWPALTLLRGNPVWDGHDFTGERDGRFLPAGRSTLRPTPPSADPGNSPGDVARLSAIANC